MTIDLAYEGSGSGDWRTDTFVGIGSVSDNRRRFIFL
ncbi:Ail/Lom family outer membrane beta-barrel protein [Shigella sonnei]